MKKFFLPILHVVYRIDFVKMTENKIYIFVSKQLMYIFKKGMQIVQIQLESLVNHKLLITQSYLLQISHSRSDNLI